MHGEEKTKNKERTLLTNKWNNTKQEGREEEKKGKREIKKCG